MYSVRQYDVNFSFHCRSIKAIWLLCNKQNLLKQMRLLEQNNSRHCVKIRWSMHSEGLRLEKKMYNSYKRQPLGHRTPTFTCKLLRENRVCLLVAYLFGAPHCMAFAQSYPNCSRWLHNVSFVSFRSMNGMQKRLIHSTNHTTEVVTSVLQSFCKNGTLTSLSHTYSTNVCTSMAYSM